jgi:lipopolysaccharide/colanic/teichoic acid biosynthesis glycosyltransferase
LQANSETHVAGNAYAEMGGTPLALQFSGEQPSGAVNLVIGRSHDASSSGEPELSLVDMQAGAQRANRSFLKRLLDIAGASLGLLVLLPLFALIAAWIKFESRGPALFRQRRAGLDGRVFEIYKFRSMRVVEDGETIVQAAQSDERVTKLGAFLRRSCIDELPQLLNVLKGDMSLVGPRPHAMAHDTYYSAIIPEYRSRLMVRPGIAGLAQVSGYRGATPTIESMAGRVSLDREYIATWSLAQDLKVLMRAVTEGPFHPAAF